MKPYPVLLWAALFPGIMLAAVQAPLPARGAGQAHAGAHPETAAGFSLEASPSSIAVTPGGAAQQVTIVAFAENGFTGTIAVKAGTLPTGVTVMPASFTLAAGSVHTISVSVSSAAKAGTASIQFAGTSGAFSANTKLTLSLAAPAIPSMSASFFDFGGNLVHHGLVETVTAITNNGAGTLKMSPVLSGDPSYSIVTAKSCGAELAPAHACDMVIEYDPKTASAPSAQSTLLNMNFANVPAGTPQTAFITGMSAVLTPGVVTATNNPQVALYTMTLPFPGEMKVSFGTTEKYGHNTWFQSTDEAGGQVSIFVAGMLQKTLYHMVATVEFSNGLAIRDQDHTFTTGEPSAALNLQLTVDTTSGMTPQPGLELLNPVNGVVVTDLAGEVLWTYDNPPGSISVLDGAKTLPNGDLLVTIGPLSNVPLTESIPEDAITEIREINLGGDTVREITVDDLNNALTNATCAECNVSLLTFHHDVTPLPNGHWLVLSNTMMNLSPNSTPPLTNEKPQTVLGDVIVDLDENLQPVWVWNEFNHLDPNRHPFEFPDWTHTNAILYSPDDGNIIVSIRHQNWVLKIDYANGTHNGDILWRLGYQGDFTLENGTSPTDWQYAQHGPGFFTANTSGIFSLGLMDNGDDRVFPAGVTCTASGNPAPACYYTTIPVFQINEKTMTAKLTFHQKIPPALYSDFGGNTDQLANGDVEYDLCGLLPGSDVFEVTPEAEPKTVWTMHTGSTQFYRAFRIPSLYPGVQW
jgi:arylsulfate sulfotransferase